MKTVPMMMMGKGIEDIGTLGQFSDVVISDDGNYIVLVDSLNHKVFYSTNGGTSFSESTGVSDVYAGVNPKQISASSDGQYVLFANGYNNKFFISSNYGANFTTKSITAGSYSYGAFVSDNGQNMLLLYIASSYTYCNRSTDYGVTWANTLIGQTDYFQIAISQTLQYILVGLRDSSSNDYLKKSTNYGASFSTVSGAQYASEWRGAAMSDDGLYQFACYTSGSSFSTNYGSTFTSGSTNRGYTASMSANGQYIISVYSTCQVYRSVNSGSSWTNATVGVTGDIPWASKLSSSGQYQLISVTNSTEGGSVYISNDYGANWYRKTLDGINKGRLDMSANGQYMIVCPYHTSTGYVYVSKNYGATWNKILI